MAKTFSFEEALVPDTASPVTFSFEDAMPKATNPFLGSAGASTERLKGEMALLAAKLGLKDAAEAEKYYREQEAKGSAEYIPTTKGWMEAPGTKIAELAGGSLPYMAAPLAVAGAAALAPEVAIAGIGGAALAGGATSAAQFTGSNLARQVQEGKSLEEASLGKAAAAAVPQAALDIIGFKMLPGVRTIFGKAGMDLTEEAAAEVAKRSLTKIAQDFTLRTGKVMTAEGLTEAGQQVLERMQAGLKITDPQARQEYLDSFVGGAVLGGVISGPGQLIEGAMKKPEAAEVPTVATAAPATQPSEVDVGQAIVNPEEIEIPQNELVEVRPNVFIYPPNPTVHPGENYKPVYENDQLIGFTPTAVAPTPESAAEPVTITPDIVTTEQNQPLTETAPPVTTAAAPVIQEIPPGFERFEQTNADGTITSGIRRIETPAATTEEEPFVPNEAWKQRAKAAENNFDAVQEKYNQVLSDPNASKEQIEEVTTEFDNANKQLRRAQLAENPAEPAPVDPAVVADAWNSESKLLAETSNAPVVEFEKLPADLQQRIADTYAKDGKLGAKNMVQFMPEVEQFKEPVQEPVKKEAKRKTAPKSNTLLAELTRLGGVSLASKQDVTGEKGAMLPGGYSRVFTNKSKTSLMGHIELGNLDEYLPYDMRLATQTMQDQAYDSTPAYEYLAERIANGEKILPYAVEEEIAQNEYYLQQEANAQQDIDEAAQLLNEEEINELFRIASTEEREAATEAAEFVAPSEGVTPVSGEREEAGLKLEGQTADEIKAEEKAKEAARKAEAEQEAKAKAQDTAKDFVLAGSDRDVDQAAARGAQDLFAAPKAEPKKTAVQELADNFAPTESGTIYNTQGKIYEERFDDKESGWTLIKEPDRIVLLGKPNSSDKDYTIHSWVFDPKVKKEELSADAQARMWAELNEIKPAAKEKAPKKYTAEKAIQELDDLEMMAEGKGPFRGLIKKFVKNGLITEKQAASYDYLFKDRDMGPSDLAYEIRTDLEIEGEDNFTNNISMKDIMTRTVEVRDEIITEYAGVKKRISTATKKVAKTGGTLDLQRRLNDLLNYADVLKNAIEASKPANNSAEYFMARATKELAAENITPEVEAVIRRIYDKFPNLLEGLRLSVRNPKGGMAAGNFSPINNLVTLWNGTAGVTDPETVRHEIMHSLEKMMTPAARNAVVKEWADALEAAMKKYTGPREAAYFEAVLEFLDNPTKETYDRATKIMPSIDLYQYLNPSEYWAVNAEKLFAAKLGTPWNRFVLAVKKLFETMKSLFGFRSKISVHKAFSNLINNERTDEGQMLTTYFTQTNAKIDFLNNVQEDRDLVEEYDVPEVPAHEVRSKKDMLIAGWKKVQRLAEDIAKEPKVKTVQALNTAGDSITQARIESVWLGAGVDQADQKKYNGQIRTANGQAAASLAVKNAIHAGNISTQVIIQGGMEYSQKFLQFVAVKRDKSMANVVLLQAKLRDKLGTVLADKIVNAYFAARRTRGIQNQYLDALAAAEDAKVVLAQARMSGIEEDIAKAEAESYQANKHLKNVKVAYEKAPAYLCVLDEEEPTITADGKTIPNVMYDEDGLPVLNDEAIDAFIDRDNEHPELKEMMDNWTSVNHNMLDMMAVSGRISKKEAERLKEMKDYSPWYRVMDEQEDIYDSSKMTTLTSGIKHFKPGRTERDIDNVVESMLHNVTMMTRSSIRTFANNRVVMEYAERRPSTIDKKTGKEVQGKIRVYAQEGKDETGVRLPIFISGQRVIVKIPDSQVADAILGLAMGPFESKILDAMSGSANFLRRAITFSGYFQLKQVFYDAPTAAWVSGVKSPFKLWAECFGGFARAVAPFRDDATVELLRAAGIGGFQSHYRTAKKELNIELGAMSHSNFSRALKLIDHIGDASDYSQRIAVYDRVVKETGDPALAMMQAADIIDFQKHGKSRFAQAFRSTVSFMQAWATQLDALTQASIGKNIKGKKRTEAVQQFYWTATKLASVSLLYAMLAGGDDDYHELDDETKARNFYIPFSKKMYGHHILIPMHTTASLFWKVLPETLHYKFSTEGTANEMDGRRFRHLMSEMAMDSILGPNPIPSLIKPLVEVKFNHNFFTGGNLTPRSLEGLDAAEQYNASTSELGKFISKITAYAGGDGEPEKRLITPIEGDHLARGYAGSIATLSMWASNVMFPENRVAPQAKDNPFLGGLMGADVQRKNESLVYELMDENEKYFNTFKKLKERGDPKADQYLSNNINQIRAYQYAQTVTKGLQDLNKEIRRVGESRDASFTPEQRRDRINKLKEIKEKQAMAGVIEFRKLADR